MDIVSNTSTLISLAKINELSLLKVLRRRLVTPSYVYEESVIEGGRKNKQDAYIINKYFVDGTLQKREVTRKSWGEVKRILSKELKRGDHDVLALAIQLIIGLFTGDFSQVLPVVENIVNGIIDFFVNLGTAIWELVSNIVMSIIEFFTGLYDTLVGNSIIPDMVNAIIEWFAKLPSKLLEIAQSIYTYLVNKWTEIKTMVTNKVSQLVSSAKEKFYEILDKITSIMGNLKSRIAEKWESIKSTAASKIESIKSTIKSKFEAAKDIVVGIFTDLKDTAGEKLEALKGFIQPVIDKFNDIKSAVQGVIDKISGISFPSVPDWIPGFATGVRDFSGGLSLVGERGAELTYLPSGSDVYNARETKNILNNLAQPPTSRLITAPTGITNGATTKVYNINMQVNPDSIKSLQDFEDLIESISEGS